MRSDEINKRFERYVQPCVIDRVLAGQNPPMSEQLDLLLVLADIGWGSVQEISDRVDALYRISRAEGGLIESNLSTLFLIVFGLPIAGSVQHLDGAAIATEILNGLSSNVRVVYMRASAYRGSFGRDEHSFQGTISADMVPAIAMLSGLEFGQSACYGVPGTRDRAS
jgi:hypothetical protein